jgi:flagellar protein FliJ
MAKRFAFRLEPLLRLRQQREDEKKRIVAQRLREIGALEHRRQTLQVEIGRQTQIMRDVLVAETVDVDQLKMSRHWVIRLRRGVLELDAQISGQRALLAQERADLAEARKDTKVLERLKDRQRGAYLAAINRQEQAELDEMNSLRFAYAMMRDGGSDEANESSMAEMLAELGV